MGTENGGLTIIHLKTKQFHTYLPKEGETSSISSNSIWSIYADNEQRIWMGTYNKGVCLMDPKNMIFKGYQRNPFDNNSLADNDILGFAKDQNGNIWIATDGGGISIFDAKHKKFIQNLSTDSPNLPLTNNATKVILCDSQNNIWIGSWGGGVDKINKERNSIRNYPVVAGGFGDQKILCLLEDSQKNMWAGTGGSGLFMFDPKQDTFIQTDKKIHGIDIPEGSFINAIYEDSDKILWVGTFYGLFALKPKSKGKYDTKSYYRTEKRDSIKSNRIQVIFEDSKKRLWFGSFDNGLNMFDKKKAAFTYFNQSNGLASNMVNGILEDNQGYLWISSNKGITKFNPKDGGCRIYTVAHGLLSNDFYPNACFKTSEGQFFLGSDKGFNTFFPDHIFINPIKPVMYFTDFKINHVSAKIGAEKSPLSKHISHTQQIVLHYTQTNFTLDFVGLGYVRPSTHQYKYKLIGLSDEWTDLGNKTSITFTGLKPGNYELVVLGANNDGIWSDKPARIQMIIQPPFWQTWWAYLLYLAFISGVIIIIFRVRLERVRILNSLKMEQLAREKEQELNQSKLQFFTNISHEFRTPLSLIIAPLENLIASTQMDASVKPKIFNIYTNANRLMRLVNELMDFRKIENKNMPLQVQKGDIVKFITELTLGIKDACERKNISMDIQASQESIITWFDSHKLDKIILNILSNAMKYTEENGFIHVDMGLETWENEKEDAPTFISIAITDNGKGISEEDLPHIFERFYQAKSSIHQGTGIGLSLVKSLTELHHGQINVESKLGMGTKFTLILPLSQDAYTEEERIETPMDIVSFDDKGYIEMDDAFVKDFKDVNLKDSSVLIVENNNDLRDYLMQELGKTFHIRTAKDGQEGLELAFDNPPDLILSDVMMPRMNGMELCKAIKEDLKTSHIPVVLLTAKTTIDDQINGLEYGADVYITKPFSIRFLLAQIQRIIANQKYLYKVFSQEVHLTPGQFAKNDLDKKFLQTITDYIIGNIDDSQLSVETIAATLGLSRGQLYNKIKALTGQTAVDFIRTIRLKQAVKLMETRKFTIAEIAYQTGFTSPSYFTRSFKAHYGKSPSSYLDMD
jgi:signal transduction histidine kinase/DNA-binding response OmpR family regulator/sugar lactone lactonase YvrE